jgi:hypothetical protein
MFRDRYYLNNGTYSALDSRHRTQYPMLLFFVLSGAPEKLH